MPLIKRYSANEAEKLLAIDRHLFPLFREAGLLKGTRYGQIWKYDEEELNDFVRKTRGYDLGNREKIKYYAPYILAAEDVRAKLKK